MTEGASPVASGRYPGYFLEYKQELWVTSSAAAEWRGMQLTRTRWSLALIIVVPLFIFQWASEQRISLDYIGEFPL
jgi:hypothetical protein